ncbi:hypothetical protein V6N13_114012 [Hibiscus sabdariffa]
MAKTGDIPEGQQSNLQVHAIIRELRKTLQEDLESIHDRLDRLEGSQTNNPDEDHAENGSDQTLNQRQNSIQGLVQQVDDDLTNIKVAIPSFQGREILMRIWHGKARWSTFFNVIINRKKRNFGWQQWSSSITPYSGGISC